MPGFRAVPRPPPPFVVVCQVLLPFCGNPPPEHVLTKQGGHDKNSGGGDPHATNTTHVLTAHLVFPRHAVYVPSGHVQPVRPCGRRPPSWPPLPSWAPSPCGWCTFPATALTAHVAALACCHLAAAFTFIVHLEPPPLLGSMVARLRPASRSTCCALHLLLW